MEFTLSTSGNFYSNEEQMEKYEKLGFTFVTADAYEDMKIKGCPKIIINSLEDLIALQKDLAQELIIREGHIRIYDNYE